MDSTEPTGMICPHPATVKDDDDTAHERSSSTVIESADGTGAEDTPDKKYQADPIKFIYDKMVFVQTLATMTEETKVLLQNFNAGTLRVEERVQPWILLSRQSRLETTMHQLNSQRLAESVLYLRNLLAMRGATECLPPLPEEVRWYIQVEEGVQ